MRRLLTGLACLCMMLAARDDKAERKAEPKDEIKFTAERLGTLAAEHGRGLLDRYAGFTIEVSGKTGTRSILNNHLTLEIAPPVEHGPFGVVCESAEHTSLQAAAVLANNQTVKVRGAIADVSNAGRSVTIAPCTLLTNNVDFSPTAVLTEPYAAEIAKTGPPAGHYRCRNPGTNVFKGTFTILASNHYTDSSTRPGKLKYDAERKLVEFIGGPFDHWPADYKATLRSRLITLHPPGGDDRACEWQGE